MNQDRIDIAATILISLASTIAHTVFLHLDDTLSTRNTANLELGYNHVHDANTPANAAAFSRSLEVLGHDGTLSSQSLTSRLGLSIVVNPRTFNAAIFAFAIDHRDRTPNSPAPEQFINGFDALGGDSTGQHLYTSRQFQLSDDLTLTRGSRALTPGGQHHFPPTEIAGMFCCFTAALNPATSLPSIAASLSSCTCSCAFKSLNTP